MKRLAIILALAFATNVNAEIIIDDFSTGELETTSFGDLGPTDLYQVGTMAGEHRMLIVHVREKKDDQNVQVRIEDSKLVASFGYNTVGVLKVNYGSTPNGLAPMNLDLSEHEDKSLIVEFEAKSSVSGIHVGFFTNSDRAVWSDHVEARGGNVAVKIPLSDLEVIGKNFTLENVDYIRFQFDSRTKTGHNFAIKKIWIN